MKTYIVSAALRVHTDYKKFVLIVKAANPEEAETKFRQEFKGRIIENLEVKDVLDLPDMLRLSGGSLPP